MSLILAGCYQASFAERLNLGGLGPRSICQEYLGPGNSFRDFPKFVIWKCSPAESGFKPHRTQDVKQELQSYETAPMPTRPEFGETWWSSP